ncbi:hypothetical protein DPEC_G00318060 [Dallia pectoralis]|uniref:Uncharacterized protein n=1 Tax=Dallia pectoralis TaxID=75939 RepID=A0ACC2FD24_DALPE|nr:hypothetical protein DPEC_G00318060 [Dallia pectoralis]
MLKKQGWCQGDTTGVNAGGRKSIRAEAWVNRSQPEPIDVSCKFYFLTAYSEDQVSCVDRSVRGNNIWELLLSCSALSRYAIVSCPANAAGTLWSFSASLCVWNTANAAGLKALVVFSHVCCELYLQIPGRLSTLPEPDHLYELKLQPDDSKPRHQDPHT